MAGKLLNEALPISVEYAKKTGMVDEVFAGSAYYEVLHDFASSCYDEDLIWEKQDRFEEEKEIMERCKQAELKKMYREFWDESSEFHKFRHEFVYKVCPTETAKRLQGESCA